MLLWFVRFPEFAEFGEFLFDLGKTQLSLILLRRNDVTAIVGDGFEKN